MICPANPIIILGRSANHGYFAATLLSRARQGRNQERKVLLEVLALHRDLHVRPPLHHTATDVELAGLLGERVGTVPALLAGQALVSHQLRYLELEVQV